MPVLERKRDGPPAREPDEETARGAEDLQTGSLALEELYGGRKRGRKLDADQHREVGQYLARLVTREELPDAPVELLPSARVVVLAADPGELAQHLDERRIRNSFAVGDRAALEPEHVALFCACPRLGQQARLADTRITGQEDETAAPVNQLVDAALEHRLLPRASDEP